MFVCEAGSSTNMVRSVPDALKQHPCVCVQGVYMRVRVCVCLRVEQGFLQICKYDTVCARCVETAYVCMCVQCMSVFTCACVRMFVWSRVFYKYGTVRARCVEKASVCTCVQCMSVCACVQAFHELVMSKGVHVR